jgi:ABC-type nitrate/sulfonate/bicarbonate transport system substrate-binding protein
VYASAGRNSSVAAVLAAVLLALGLSACGGGNARTLAPGSSLRVGYSFPFDSADLAGRIALDSYGQARRITITTQELGGAPNAVSALTHGQIDLASLNLPDAIRAIGQGARLQVILGSKMFPEYVYVATDGITRPAQLKGKRVGNQGPRSDIQAFTELLLGQAGLTLGDVHVSTVPNSTARAAALLRGRIDATGLRYHEYLRLIRKKPGIHVLSQMRYFEPMRMTQVWVVTDDFAKHNTRELQTMVTDMLASYTSTYTGPGRRVWLHTGAAGVFKGDPSQIPAQVYAYYHRFGMWPRTNQPITTASYATMLKELTSTGQVARPVAFRSVWNPTFWQRAAGAG